MISFLEFMERLTKLNRDVNNYFCNLIKEKKYSLTSLELLLLMKISQTPCTNTKEIAQKGSNLFSHLRFLLTSLEKKKLIDLKSHVINDPNPEVLINSEGLKITKSFHNVKIPDDILKSLETLELFSKNFSSK